MCADIDDTPEGPLGSLEEELGATLSLMQASLRASIRANTVRIDRIERELAAMNIVDLRRRVARIERNTVAIQGITFNTAIADLDLSARTLNRLSDGLNIETVRDLTQYRERDLLKLRNFGRKSLNEVKNFLLEEFGVRLAP